MDNASEERSIKLLEERKDFLGALKCALTVTKRSFFLDLKIGKYYRILGFPEKAMDIYICAANTYPDRISEVYKQIDACIRYIYQRYLTMNQFIRPCFYFEFPKMSTGKLRARMDYGLALLYCDGNTAFKELLLKIVSGRLKTPIRVSFILSNITSVDLLNLSRFVKIVRSTIIQRVHFQGHFCHHAFSLLLNGLVIEEIIIENLKLSDISEPISIQVKNFSIIGQIHEQTLCIFQINSVEHFVGPLHLIDKMRISVGPRCHTLQGSTTQKVELKQLKNLRSLSLVQSTGENEFSLDQLNSLVCLGRLNLTGYVLQGTFFLQSLRHLELHRFTGSVSLINILSQNMQIRSLVIDESSESLKKSIAELICRMTNLKELIIASCSVDLFFLECIVSNFFKTSRVCLGLVNCGADNLVSSLTERYPNKHIFHDNATYELLRERSWPETKRYFYYRE